MSETHRIFRQGTKPANRFTLASNITNFIKDNHLDGVDIDLEYPGVSFKAPCLLVYQRLTL